MTDRRDIEKSTDAFRSAIHICGSAEPSGRASIMSARRYKRYRRDPYDRSRSATSFRDRTRRPEDGDNPVSRAAGAIGQFLGWLIQRLFGQWRKSPEARQQMPPVGDSLRRTLRGASPSPGLRYVSGLRPPAGAQLPYRRRPHLVSKGERAFWFPLYQAVKGRYRIFCKVRLQDVVSAPDESGERYWFRRIQGYHVDFVLCDPATTAPLLAIELDDRSHDSPKALDRDRFKDEVLAAGGVPVYRVRAQQAYDPIQLSEEIERRLSA